MCTHREKQDVNISQKDDRFFFRKCLLLHKQCFLEINIEIELICDAEMQCCVGGTS